MKAREPMSCFRKSRWAVLTIVWGLSIVSARSASASDGGTTVDASDESDAGAMEGGSDDDAGGGVALACGGALCDTSNGAAAGGSCDVAQRAIGRTSLDPTLVFAAIAALTWVRRRQRESRDKT
jgi:hypothetical protein